MATIDSGDLRELTLHRVSGFWDDWFKENDPPFPQPIGRTVGSKRVGRAVQEMIDKGCSLVTVQRMSDDAA